MKKGRISLFWLILIIGMYLGFEISCYLTLKLIGQRGDGGKSVEFSIADNEHRLRRLIAEGTSYYRYSRTLGWTIKENGKTTLYHANRQGIRADRETSSEPAPGSTRISAFGDSFTHGDEVANRYTWQEQINRFDEHFDVVNFGVGGFGLDQALLRYREENRRFRSHIVFIGYMTENINRHVNVFRPFYVSRTGLPLGKPRFRVKNEKLLLIPNPFQNVQQYNKLIQDSDSMLNRIGAHDYFYHRKYKYNYTRMPSARLIHLANQEFFATGIFANGQYNLHSEAYEISTRVIDQFYNEVLDNNSLPVIILFPTKKDIEKYWDNQKRVDAPLLKYIRDKGYRFIDLQEAFALYRPLLDEDDLSRNHYKKLGNEVVAKYILYYLQSNRLEHEIENTITAEKANRRTVSAFHGKSLQKSFAPDTIIEAEDGYVINRNSPLLETDGFASGKLMSDDPNASGEYVQNGIILFKFSISNPGKYSLRARVLAKSNSANSFFVKMDLMDYDDWHIKKLSDRWTWSQSHYRWFLAKGSHTLVIARREPTLIDQISLVTIDR